MGVIKSYIKPYRQGGLESTCGLYSVVNAYAYLTGESDEKCQLLATEIKDFLSKKKLFSSIYDGGMGFSEMKLVTENILAKYVKNISLSWRSFPNPTTRKFWNSSIDFLKKENTCMIIGTTGREHHWTVVISATRKTMRLLDSEGWKYLRYSESTTTVIDDTKYVLYPAQTFFISN